MKANTRNTLPASLLLAASALLVSACNATPPSATASNANAAPATQVLPASTPALPLVIVHKDPNCGCCVGWAAHMREAGFPVELRDSNDMMAVKQKLGIDEGMLSCHTSEIDGYVVEGHVPVQDIQRLLVERPKARGLVLPGMPLGSPGMETPDGHVQPYQVALLNEDGSLTPYSSHP